MNDISHNEYIVLCADVKNLVTFSLVWLVLFSYSEK